MSVNISQVVSWKHPLALLCTCVNQSSQESSVAILRFSEHSFIYYRLLTNFSDCSTIVDNKWITFLKSVILHLLKNIRSIRARNIISVAHEMFGTQPSRAQQFWKLYHEAHNDARFVSSLPTQLLLALGSILYHESSFIIRTCNLRPSWYSYSRRWRSLYVLLQLHKKLLIMTTDYNIDKFKYKNTVWVLLINIFMVLFVYHTRRWNYLQNWFCNKMMDQGYLATYFFISMYTVWF